MCRFGMALRHVSMTVRHMCRDPEQVLLPRLRRAARVDQGWQDARPELRLALGSHPTLHASPRHPAIGQDCAEK